MKVYDNYEISPCTRTEESDKPGHFYFEVCEPHEADVWTLYGHIDGEGVEAIGDFATREHAEEVFRRITGIHFNGSREVPARLRVMHAAPELLEAIPLLIGLVHRLLPRHAQSDSTLDNLAEVIRARAALFKATAIHQPTTERRNP
jgi:hypothetical protein